MVWVKMWVNRLTHTVTHIGISGFAAYCQLMPHGYNEMRGKSQRVPERKLLLSLRYFCVFFLLTSLAP